MDGELRAHVQRRLVRAAAKAYPIHPADGLRLFISSVSTQRLARQCDLRTALYLKDIYHYQRCPRCGAPWEQWRFDWKGAEATGRPCSWVSDNLRWVRWRCGSCGRTFIRCENDAEEDLA